MGSSTVQNYQVTHQKATEDNTKPSTSQGTNVIVISNKDESQFDDIIISKQEKSNFLFQFFPLSKHSREEIGPLVEINDIESDCMSEYDKGWNCVGAPRQLKLIKGDGNYYFRTISYTISGTEDFHDKVRETVCDYIEYFDYDIAPFLKRKKVKYERISYMGYRNQNHGNSQNVLKGRLHMV